jgi:hypothetical protein
LAKGRIICLGKCRKLFNSKDIKRNRLCSKCNNANYGLKPVAFGADNDIIDASVSGRRVSRKSIKDT